MIASLDLAKLYERDFVRWTESQAAELRRAAEAGANLPLDWLRLAEEVEALGERDRREHYSRLVRAIEHLLKLQFAPVEQPRRVWEVSVLNQRRDLHQLLRSSPSLKRTAKAVLAQAHEEALQLVERSIPDAEQPLWPDLPRTCPFALDQVLDRHWWPERLGQ
jgi:hypothetical protein